MKLEYSLIVALSFFLNLCNAQGKKISGKVLYVDEKEGEIPIPGAKIEIPLERRTFFSDFDGSFTLDLIKNMPLTVIFSAFECDSTEIKITSTKQEIICKLNKIRKKKH
ncbi:carboxypeptidase-like regulatory domain-containing protein [Flavobacterium humidisoli]|uniref:Carboxypeptidase-like regulatory domain-containing protein n=1 Tax=Flavobacterium humidisoli TaxID=2937442 RepID=A0ABY4M1R8_9FLAO|nr:carboxypeptidase-like regulatory domain-containing protein [Flavobacterium humidisoli]UPZ17875.1 carboxypeptidase-like regulatory domain-containing protein [Flavobacterium humidisoli]